MSQNADLFTCSEALRWASSCTKTRRFIYQTRVPVGRFLSITNRKRSSRTVRFIYKFGVHGDGICTYTFNLETSFRRAVFFIYTLALINLDVTGTVNSGPDSNSYGGVRIRGGCSGSVLKCLFLKSPSHKTWVGFVAMQSENKARFWCEEKICTLISWMYQMYKYEMRMFSKKTR